MKIVLLNPSKKGKKKMAKRRKSRRAPARKIARRKVRKNPGKPFSRKRTRRAFPKIVSRHRRRIRRNPKILRGFSIKGILNQIKPMAFGALGGVGVNMLFNRFVTIGSPAVRPWLKLGVAAALPMVLKRGILGDAAKYGAIVVGAAAIKELVQSYTGLALDGYSLTTDEVELLGSSNLAYPVQGNDYADVDYGELGSSNLEYL